MNRRLVTEFARDLIKCNSFLIACHYGVAYEKLHVTLMNRWSPSRRVFAADFQRGVDPLDAS